MAITDAPTVHIGGVQLASQWSLRSRIALAGLAITWGRSTHLKPAEPASLLMEVLDTDGQLASTSSLQGQRITVTRGDGRVIFRGRVDDFDIDHAHVMDPDTDIRRRVWRFTIRASDVLAELAISNLPGPGMDPFLIPGLGAHYWDTVRPRDRFDQLLAAGADKVVSSIDWSDPYPVTDTQPAIRWRTWAEGYSALDHIEGAYKAHALGYVNYDPSANAITIGRPADTLGLELEWDGATLDVDLNDGITVPAHDVLTPEGYTARLGLDDAVDVVQIISPQIREISSAEFVDATTEALTARADPDATGRREHRIANDVVYSFTPQNPDDGGTGGGFEPPFPYDLVTSSNDEFRTTVRPNHNGLDFGRGAANVAGTPIPAAGAGTVETVGVPGSGHGWGYYVLLDHGTINGHTVKTRYAHMFQLPWVAVGDEVSKGEDLGGIGSTGNSTGNHLHWETIVDGEYMNPRTFIEQFGGTNPDPDPVPDAGGEWQKLLAADTVVMLDQLNGRVLLPTIRFDWRKRTYSNTVTTGLLDTFAKDIPLYFPGSVFATIYDAATEMQVIGGRLVYFEGWTLDATVAPAIRTRDGVTVDELVRIDEPTISDYADRLIIADLGAVTKGVTA